ncbi:MAG TPA: glycosyltransferase [Woeseiaceae bacterium]|nr:glycosyltransferase [Woeseiaceae bacterium]
MRTQEQAAVTHDLYVVVPFFNEEQALPQTLRALVEQENQNFALVLVDNGSTDASAAIAIEFSHRIRHFAVQVIQEPVKGTGAAADTGFRHAIAAGARWIARTDADCLPRANWTRVLRQALEVNGLDFVAGRIKPRQDELPLSRARRALIGLVVWIAENYGKIHRRGPQFRYPYFMAAGNNLAISAELYLQSGGFPRSSLEDVNEDRVLSETVRTLTANAAFRDDLVVHNSVRRLQAYGVVNTLRWYRNRGYRPDVVDIR